MKRGLDAYPDRMQVVGESGLRWDRCIGFLVAEFAISPQDAWRCTLRDMMAIVAYKTHGMTMRNQQMNIDELEKLRAHLREMGKDV